MDRARQLRKTVIALGDVVEAKSKFGGRGLAFHVGGREFLHFHGPTLVDVRLTRPLIKALTPAERAHCVARRTATSDWIEVRMATDDGCSFAVSAARRAWDAARSPRTPRPSPRGASRGKASRRRRG